MDTEVNASDVLVLLSQRLADALVEVDKHRVLIKKMSEQIESLSELVMSYSNMIQSLERQVEETGGTPVTGVREGVQRVHNDE